MKFISPISRYSYVNAKLKGKIGQMITDDRIEAMLKSKSVPQVLHYLENTDYKPLIELYQNHGDVQSLEAFLFEKQIAMFKDTAKLFDDKYKTLILAMSRKAEVENLKGIIRLYFSKQIKKENIDYRLSYLYHKTIIDDIDYLKIANATSFDLLLEALSESIYYKALKEYDDEKLKAEGLFFLEVKLDQAWSENLKKYLKLLSRADRLVFQKILNTDADLKNIINLFRYSHVYHLDNTELEAIMIKDGSLINSPQYEAFLASEPNKRSIKMLLGVKYKDLAIAIEKNEHLPVIQQVFLVEKYLFNIRKKEFNSLLRGNPFSIGIVLSYFFLEEKQDQLIKSLINGVHYNLDASTIREFVV